MTKKRNRPLEKLTSEYYRKNREAHKLVAQAWRDRNKERYLQKAKEYREKNKEKVNACIKRCREEKQDYYNLLSKKYYWKKKCKQNKGKKGIQKMRKTLLSVETQLKEMKSKGL